MGKFKIFVTILFALIICIGPFACVSGDDFTGFLDDDGSDDKIKLTGRITELIVLKKEKSGYYYGLKELLGFTTVVNAQGSDLGDIEVTAFQDGEEVDSDETNDEGEFDLDVDPGFVTLVFDVGGSEASTTLIAPEEGELDMILIIDMTNINNQVEIVDITLLLDSIDCKDESITILKQNGEDILIDGGGRDCIKAENNCTLFLDPGDIEFTDCERCIDANGTSDVNILSPEGVITCVASEDGIRSRDSAEVSVEASAFLGISGQKNAIRARDNSFISISAQECDIEGVDDQIREDDNGEVDTSGCITSNLPEEDKDEPKNVFDAIDCDSGTVTIIKPGSEDITIDGGGQDCISIEGDCRVIIDPGDINFINCERCVDARDIAEVSVISATGKITCNAAQDAIRALDNSVISFEAAESITLNGQEDGIKAENQAEVKLSSPECTVNAIENQFDISDTALVDITMCENIDIEP